MNNFKNELPDPKDKNSDNGDNTKFSYERPDPDTSRPLEREKNPGSSNPDKGPKLSDKKRK